MELTLDKKSKSGTLVLKDELTINRIREIHEEIEKALSKVKDLIVDIGQATSFDLTFLQLMCSAHRSAVDKNKTVTLSGTDNPMLEKAVQDNRYLRTSGCVLDKNKTCLWMVKQNE